MTSQERLYVLNELNQKMERVIELLEHMALPKENVEIKFSPASEKASDKFIKDRQTEIFESLDGRK